MTRLEFQGAEKLNYNHYLGTGGDCVSHYENMYEGKLKDFIALVLEISNEFGEIYIERRGFGRELLMKYDRGKIVHSSDLYEKYKESDVKVINGDGGWGMMDYCCEVKGE